MNRKILLLIICLVVIMLTSCSRQKKEIAKNSKSAEMTLIKKVIQSSIGWAKDKDLSLLYSVIANDSAFLEVHPDKNVVIGFNNFKKAESFWMNPNFKAVSYEVSDLRLNISNSGDVAWWYCVLDDINEWKGQPANWENTRWTGVLEKREGKWVIVQMHFSFAQE